MKPADLIPTARRYASTWPLSFVLAICEKESGRHDAAGKLIDFDERAFAIDRNGGSYGLMQLDLPTARDRGFRGAAAELFDVPTNLQLGVKQLDWIDGDLKRNGFAGGLGSIAAAYNEGARNVLRGHPDVRYVGMVELYRRRWQVALGEGVT